MIGLILDKMSGGHLTEFKHQLPLDGREKISQGLHRAIVNETIPVEEGQNSVNFLASHFVQIARPARVGEYNIFHSKLSGRESEKKTACPTTVTRQSHSSVRNRYLTIRPIFVSFIDQQRSNNY